MYHKLAIFHIELISLINLLLQGLQSVWDFNYLHASKLACYCFMDASRRRENPWSETKDFITAQEVACPGVDLC